MAGGQAGASSSTELALKCEGCSQMATVCTTRRSSAGRRRWSGSRSGSRAWGRQLWWACVLTLNMASLGLAEVRRVIEIYEPFPFTPDGFIKQVQHAQQAVKKGSLSVAIAGQEGVVIAGERRRPSPLLLSSSKIGCIDKHLGYVMSGVVPDGQYLIKKARVIAQRHWFEYGEDIGVSALLTELSKVVTLGERRPRINRKTLLDELRSQPTIDPHDDDSEKQDQPARYFGVGFLIGGWQPRAATDDRSTSRWVVYELEPSGMFVRWEARAIGDGAERAEAILETLWKPEMSLRECLTLAVHVCSTVIGEARGEPVELEAALVTTGDDGRSANLRKLSQQELEQTLRAVANDLSIHT